MNKILFNYNVKGKPNIIYVYSSDFSKNEETARRIFCHMFTDTLTYKLPYLIIHFLDKNIKGSSRQAVRKFISHIKQTIKLNQYGECL